MSNWKQVIGAVAPALATTAGTPLIGSAVQFLVDNFLTEDEKQEKGSDEQKLNKAVANLTPERMAELKKLDNDYYEHMKSLDVDVFRLEISDRADAREKNSDSNMPAILSIGLSVFVGLLVLALIFASIPEASRQIMEILLGVIIREWAGSMHYWYGTTRENSDRNKVVNKKIS